MEQVRQYELCRIDGNELGKFCLSGGLLKISCHTTGVCHSWEGDPVREAYLLGNSRILLVTCLEFLLDLPGGVKWAFSAVASATAGKDWSQGWTFSLLPWDAKWAYPVLLICHSVLLWMWLVQVRSWGTHVLEMKRREAVLYPGIRLPWWLRW